MSEKTYTVMVLKMTGLDEDQIQEEFSEFFNHLVSKYPGQFGMGASVLTKGTPSEKEVLRIASL